MPRLVINRAGEGSRVFELSGHRPVSIGRAKSSSVMLDDPGISRLHAVLLVGMDGHWQIVDRSPNGIQVNGVRTREARLHPADEIILGEYRVRFEEPDVRGVLTQDTVQLPQRFVRELAESAYSGTLLPVIPLGGDINAGLDQRGDPSRRVRVLERENILLTLLLRVNRALGNPNTITDIAGRVLDLVLEIKGAERGYAMLLEDSVMGGGDFSREGYAFQPAMLRFRRPSKNALGDDSPNLIISRSIINKVMQSGSPVLLADAQSDPAFSACQSVVRSGIRSAMCAPLGTSDRRFGLLYVDNASHRGMFTPEDLNVFAVIAMQAGLAIDRIRSRNEVAQQALKLSALEQSGKK